MEKKSPCGGRRHIPRLGDSNEGRKMEIQESRWEQVGRGLRTPGGADFSQRGGEDAPSSPHTAGFPVRGPAMGCLPLPPV